MGKMVGGREVEKRLPLPPYPGIIPYKVDSPEDEDVEPDENSPRLLGIEQRSGRKEKRDTKIDKMNQNSSNACYIK